MRSLSASDIVLKGLGLLLLAAVVLKGHELLTVPVANKDLWSWRPFLIFQVEFELALGIWLVSGLFKRLAWLAALLCFALFCGVTLYKALAGAASCGCFGTVHVSPWITLFAIDLPAVVALGLFRPPFAPLLSFLRGLPAIVTGRRDAIRGAITECVKPMPSLRRFAATAVLGVVMLTVTTPILALNKPAVATSTYEVLEPETWIGKKLPILEHIDIADQLEQGTWLILFYHHDCPECQIAIRTYQQIATNPQKNRVPFRIAFIEIPPYGSLAVSGEASCSHGRLNSSKRWFAETPLAVQATQGIVSSIWVRTTPDLNGFRTVRDARHATSL